MESLLSRSGGNAHSIDKDGVGDAEIEVDNDNIRFQILLYSFCQTCMNETVV